MCGIAGVSRYNENTAQLLPMMAAMMESRGQDSWGITDGFRVRRETHRVSDDYVLEDPPGAAWQWEKPMFLHTRGASIGKVAVENTHPFLVDSDDGERWILGCHNGNINNHAELMKKFPEFKYECDSNAIYKWMVEEQDLHDVRGWGALVWFEGRYGVDAKGHEKRWVDSRVRIVKFGGATMWQSTLETGEVLWGSTKDVVSVPAKMYGMRLAEQPDILWEEKRYELELGTAGAHDRLVKTESMEFGSKVIVPVTVYAKDGYQEWRTRNAHQGFPASNYVACGQHNGKSSDKSAYTVLEDKGMAGYVAPDFAKIGAEAKRKGLCVSCFTETVDRQKMCVCMFCLMDRKIDARESLTAVGTATRIVVYDQIWSKIVDETANKEQGGTPSRKRANTPWIIAVGAETINSVIKKITGDVRRAADAVAGAAEVTRVDVGGSAEVAGGASSCNVTVSEDTGEQQQVDVAASKD